MSAYENPTKFEPLTRAHLNPNPSAQCNPRCRVPHLLLEGALLNESLFCLPSDSEAPRTTCRQPAARSQRRLAYVYRDRVIEFDNTDVRSDVYRVLKKQPNRGGLLNVDAVKFKK